MSVVHTRVASIASRYLSGILPNLSSQKSGGYAREISGQLEPYTCKKIMCMCFSPPCLQRLPPLLPIRSRGWASYYQAVNPSRTFDKLDRYVWIRLRKWLEKKYRISSKQVRQQYMHHRNGPEGGYAEFAARDEEGNWVWRARTMRTKLTH